MTAGGDIVRGGGSSESGVPRHIAFIMDGNGRWAESRGLARAFGHEQGAETLRATMRRCSELGVSEITCYALSTENLRRRPPDEVRDLMGLLSHYLKSDRADIDELKIQLKFIGRRDELPIETQGIYAVYPPGRFTQPKVRAFIDFLVHAFAEKGPDSW